MTNTTLREPNEKRIPVSQKGSKLLQGISCFCELNEIAKYSYERELPETTIKNKEFKLDLMVDLFLI